MTHFWAGNALEHSLGPQTGMDDFICHLFGRHHLVQISDKRTFNRLCTQLETCVATPKKLTITAMIHVGLPELYCACVEYSEEHLSFSKMFDTLQCAHIDVVGYECDMRNAEDQKIVISLKKYGQGKVLRLQKPIVKLPGFPKESTWMRSFDATVVNSTRYYGLRFFESLKALVENVCRHQIPLAAREDKALWVVSVGLVEDDILRLSFHMACGLLNCWDILHAVESFDQSRKEVETVSTVHFDLGHTYMHVDIAKKPTSGSNTQIMKETRCQLPDS